MANEQDRALKLRLEQLRDAIIQRQKDSGQWASGKTAAGYEIGTEPSHGWLTGESYVEVLKYGRRPGKVPIYFKEIIQRWMETKGIPPRSGETIERAAESIAWVIHMKGTALHRNGYEVDIFDTPIQEFSTNLTKDLGAIWLAEVTKNI